MSVLYECKEGFILCHKKYLDSILTQVIQRNSLSAYHIRSTFFNITEPFKEPKNLSDVSIHFDYDTKFINVQLLKLLSCSNKIFKGGEITTNNAKTDAALFYENSSKKKVPFIIGGNNSNYPVIVQIEGHSYLIPPLCNFLCKDILELTCHIKEKYDFILMDPPWWNKFIRRKRKWNKDHGYGMVNDIELGNLSIESLLSNTGLVGVWCTNSSLHIKALISKIFPKWNLKYIGQWFWVKVTKKGEPVCPLAPRNAKQPYERILFAAKEGRPIRNPEPNKLIISVPSSIHSHKPPLCEVLIDYLPPEPKCLELFSRYLLPGWTSYGNEVLKLQDIELYEKLL